MYCHRNRKGKAGVKERVRAELIAGYTDKVKPVDEGSTRMLCVLTSAVGCDSRSGCQGTPVEDLNMPQFFKIDIEKKTITRAGVAQEVSATWETRIKNSQRMDGKIFLQGIEVRGWSIVICEETGKRSLTASGDDEAFVLFGVCIPQ